MPGCIPVRTVHSAVCFEGVTDEEEPGQYYFVAVAEASLVE
jgi:hypothetical protein